MISVENPSIIPLNTGWFSAGLPLLDYELIPIILGYQYYHYYIMAIMIIIGLLCSLDYIIAIPNMLGSIIPEQTSTNTKAFEHCSFLLVTLWSFNIALENHMFF